jgi:hypothetical protein
MVADDVPGGVDPDSCLGVPFNALADLKERRTDILAGQAVDDLTRVRFVGAIIERECDDPIR